ncbi:MAG: hypothetical protein FWH34_06390 [Desulfovibrionaceae bacterium]|nr:hypothetical protein [Desulfovibrionaceae bacterium]
MIAPAQRKSMDDAIKRVLLGILEWDNSSEHLCLIDVIDIRQYGFDWLPAVDAASAHSI